MDDSDSERIGRDFERSIENVRKNAYRDAMLEETDAADQHYFDVGYSRGMRTGLVVGFHRGLLDAIANIGELPVHRETFETIKNDRDELETIVQTQCELCNDPKLNDSSVSDVKRLQEEADERTVRKLSEKYAPVLEEIKLSKDEIIDIFPP